MARTYDDITAENRTFALAQPVFFVASAPLSEQGHVNLSPKGLDTFRVLSERRVAYLDLTGSGNETAAHVSENGRVTLMFCAFSGPPKILRLYGRGELVLPDDERWSELYSAFEPLPGARQIFVVDVERVQTSCGYAVPRMELVAERQQLTLWAEKKGEGGLQAYRKEKNARSIDGLRAPLMDDDD